MFFKKISKCIRLFIKENPLYSSLIILIEIISALLLPINLFYMSKLIDSTGSGKIDVFVTAIFLLTAFFNVFLSYYKNRYLLLLDFDFGHKMESAFIQKCSKLPYKDFENPKVLDLLELAEEASDGKMTELFDSTVFFISNLFRIFGLLFLFLQTGILLSLLYIAVLSIVIILDFKAINLMNKMLEGQTQKERNFKYYEEEMSNRHTLSYLKAVNGIKIFRQKVTELAKLLGKERLSVTYKAQKYTIISYFTTAIWFMVSVITLALGAYEGRITISLFVVSVTALSTALDISESLSVGLSTIAEDSFFIDKFLEMLSLEESQLKPSGQNKDFDNFSENKLADDKQAFIEFKNVWFKYEGQDKYVIKNLSFKIHRYKRTALVGHNGSGKTTVIKLILGLYYPDKGSVLINGENIKNYSREELSLLFSSVFQDYARFELSLAENIRLTKNTSSEKISELLEKVNLNKFKNMDEVNLGKMEENSIDLSGGEWQKLAILRALYAESSYILFDEPFSAIDPISEAELHHELIDLMGKRGCLLVSHRLGSAKNSDNIIVLSEGSVAEEGNHRCLMDRNGLYREMFSKQSKWYLGGKNENIV